jgi:hypothetical protein
MRAHLSTRILYAGALAGCLAAASCASGTPAPPALAYRLPDPTAVTYHAGDTLAIDIDALGQSLELRVGSTAEYGASFEREGNGLRVTLAVRDLSIDLDLPMVGPMRVDEEIVEGELVLALDRRGRVTILESPDVEEAASAFFAGPMIAQSVFPGLPGTAVQAGDSWVDTVTVAEDGDTGESSQRSITTYTVIGDTQVEGRTLLEIELEGTSELRQTMALQGAGIEQRTNLDVVGRVLWDMQRGLMFERETISTGTGTVRVAPAPAPLPTRVESRSRVRLELP